MIQNKVALTGDSAPDFNDPDGWYKAAWKVAWNWEANEAFIELSRGTAACQPDFQSVDNWVEYIAMRRGSKFKSCYNSLSTLALYCM